MSDESGRLDFGGDAPRSVFFGDGRVVGVSSAAPHERVEEVALRLGLITREQHRQASPAATGLASRRAAVLLLDRGFLKPTELTALVRRRISQDGGQSWGPIETMIGTSISRSAGSFSATAPTPARASEVGEQVRAVVVLLRGAFKGDADAEQIGRSISVTNDGTALSMRLDVDLGLVERLVRKSMAGASQPSF